MAVCLLVRVNPTTSSALNGVTVFDQKGNGFNTVTLRNGSPLCFIEDRTPGHSAIQNFKIEVESCSICKNVVWDPGTKQLSMTVSPNIGAGNNMLLKATADGSTYLASTNPPGLDGGRPIIRNTFDTFILVAVLVAVTLVVGYAVYRWMRE